jgi:hypothetical protein
MLQLLERLCLDLSYSFASYSHHLTNFLEGKGTKVAGNPCAIEKGFVFQTPLAGHVLTDFGDEMGSFFAFVKSIQRHLSSIISAFYKIGIIPIFVNDKKIFPGSFFTIAFRSRPGGSKHAT